MGRPLRVCESGLTYHAISSCRNKEFLMNSDEVKNMMMEVLRETEEKFQYKLIAFTLMGNHFHFVIETTNKIHTISKIMQRIKSVFARRYNKMHNLSGPFWNDRFSSIIAEEKFNPYEYVLFLLLYLAYNPVLARIVKRPEEYKYSSINHYFIEDYKNSFGVKIDLHNAFISLGNNFQERMKEFTRYQIIYEKMIRDKTGCEIKFLKDL